MAGLPDFIPGPSDQAAAVVLAVGCLAYAIASAGHVRRAMRDRLPDRWSSVGTSLALVGIAAMLAVAGPYILPSPFGPALLLVMVGGVLFTFVFTALRLQRVVDQLKQAMPLPSLAQPSGHEARRKTPHMLMGVGIVLYAGLGYILLGAIALLAGSSTHENLLHARDSGLPYSGHVVGLWVLLAILFILLPVELVRLRFPDTEYPWKRIIVSRLRRREKGLMGAHIHMVAGLALAFLVLSPIVADWPIMVPACLALLCVTVFADTASALVGTRWGRTKWFHNPGKSYMGSAGGTLVAFVVALPFVGLPVALASALVFLIVDVIGPVPVPVSDNLLNPTFLAVLYAWTAPYIQPMLPFF